MVFRRRLLLLGLALLLISAALVLLAPLIIPGGIRLWVRWQASRQGLQITLDKINAPLFRPVEIRGIRVVSKKGCSFQIDLEAPRAELDLDLRAILSRSRERALRRLSLHDFHGNIRHRSDPGGADCRFDWDTLHRLLPDEIDVSNANLQLKNGAAEVEIRGLYLFVSELAVGRVLARELKIAAPFFQRNIRDLHGAASWENDRLTLGAIEITRGIDLESITADFAHLQRRQIGVEMNLDAFGGKLRTSISIENRNDRTTWNVAGTGSEISLAQMSDAAHLATPARGSVRASKFTFRGDPRDISHAAASIWVEVAGLTWRDRTAETIMLGASLYNRQIQLEQLYVKQLRNQFTLTGGYLLPAKSSDWLSPDFQGEISASISDLGDFARLFGGVRNDFAGVLSVHGTVNERDRKFGGKIAVDGNSLRIFRAPVDMVSATLSLQGSELKIENLEAIRGPDFVRGQGNFELARKHKYSGRVTGSVDKIADYAAMLPPFWQKVQPEGALSFTWSGHGNSSAHSGDLHIQAQHLRSETWSDLRPFDGVVDGSYSPQSIFFRQFQISNEEAALSAFVTVASNYVQLQTLRFDLNGKPKLQGNVYLPLQSVQVLRSGDLFGSMDTSQNLNIDLSLDPMDLAELSNALTSRPVFSGTLRAKFEIYGAPGSLQLNSEVLLRDLAVFQDTARVSFELRTRTEANSLKLQGRALAIGSDAVTFGAALPLMMKSKQTSTRGLFAFDRPASGTLDFPLVMLAKLPRYLSRRENFAAGMLTGKLTLAHTLRNPELTGEVQLIDGRFRDHGLHPLAASGRVMFKGSKAELQFATLQSEGGSTRFRGDADFSNFDDISVRLFPNSPVANLSRYPQGECIDSVSFASTGRTDSSQRDHKSSRSGVTDNFRIFPKLSQLSLRGAISSRQWTLTLTERSRDDLFSSEKESKTAYHLCVGGDPKGNTLQLGLPDIPMSDLGHDAIRKFRSGAGF